MTKLLTDKRLRTLWCLGIGALVTVAFQLANAQHSFPPRQELYTLLSDDILLQACAVVAVAYLTHRALMCELGAARSAWLAVLALVFGVLNVCGCNLAYLDTLMLGHGPLWICIFSLCVCSYALAFYDVGACLWHLADRYEAPLAVRKTLERPWLLPLVCFAVILVGWMVWIIPYYPATVDFDAQRQLTVFFGYVKRSNHHPWFATLVIGSLFSVGRALGGDNFGIFFYILLRALAMAAIYAHCIAILRKAGCGRAVIVCVTLFYAITPVWGAYAKQPFKDTLAAALFSWYAFTMLDMYLDIKATGRPRIPACIAYTAAGVLSALYRNNLYYVVLITTIIMVAWLVIVRGGWKQVAIVSLAVVLCMLWNAMLVPVFHVESTSVGEALSLPYQQTARTIKYHDAEIPKDERQVINKLIAYDKVGEAYDTVISDPVKNTTRGSATRDDVMAYLKVWFAQLARFPQTYFEAAFAHTYGYYAFTRDGFPTGGYGNCGMVVLDYINKGTDAGFDRYFDFSYIDAFETSRKMLSDFNKLWHRLPLVSLTDSIPFYTWAAILYLAYACCTRDKRLFVVPVLALGLVWLSCIASPVNGSFRYFAPFAAAFPVVLGCWAAAHVEPAPLTSHKVAQHAQREREDASGLEGD